MRYRLRTLLIATLVGPPLLALLWFGAIWARFSLSPLLQGLAQVLLLPGMVAVAALVVYSIVAPPPGEKPAVTLRPWQCVLLWICQFLAEWHWFFFAMMVGGWILLWGDNTPLFSQAEIAIAAAAIAAAGASATSFRVGRGLATVTYVTTIFCFVVPLLGIAVLSWLGYLLR
ncbi:MAG: hypothetical protein WD872_08550 [Pirellulaceae bacterium]